nr:hypothetical protein [uncultured Dongia sp.]
MHKSWNLIAGLFLLSACVSGKPSAEASQLIFEQYGRADFDGVDMRRKFIDHIYLEMEGMEDTSYELRLCLGRQYEKHMTDRYFDAVDSFVADHSQKNWDDVVLVHKTEKAPYSSSQAEQEVKECLTETGS